MLGSPGQGRRFIRIPGNQGGPGDSSLGNIALVDENKPGDRGDPESRLWPATTILPLLRRNVEQAFTELPVIRNISTKTPITAVFVILVRLMTSFPL